MDEILAEVDKDNNGEVDYEEVSCFCMLSNFLHDVRKTLEMGCSKTDALVTHIHCAVRHHITLSCALLGPSCRCCIALHLA